MSETVVVVSKGLTATEAERRLRERGPLPAAATSRSYRSIAIANTFTIFNLILAVFGAATLVFGNGRIRAAVAMRGWSKAPLLL